MSLWNRLEHEFGREPEESNGIADRRLVELRRLTERVKRALIAARDDGADGRLF
jgi:hypothetical protein